METGDQNTQNTQNTQTTNTTTPPQQNTTSSHGSTTMQNNKTLMGVLAYLGILIVIPFLMSKDDPFVKFHLKQGAVLFVLEAIVWAVGVQLIMGLGAIVSILQLAFIVLSIIGIVNVLQGKEQELPIVGQFSKHFKF